MDELHHECGVAAIYHLQSAARSALAPVTGGQEEVSRLMPRVLLDLQNRGQLAAGFTTYNPHRDKLLDTYKQIGTVIEAFRLNHQAKYDSLMREYAGRAAIGTTFPRSRSSITRLASTRGAGLSWSSASHNSR